MMFMRIRRLMSQLRHMIRQCRGTLSTVDGYFDNLGYQPDTTENYKQTINKL